MARIVPKLNLNKTPQLVDNNSLIFAKNIKLLKDGTIGPDTSLEEVETNTGDGVHHIEHHDAITTIVTEFYYSILDYSNTLKLHNNQPLTDDPEFDFSVDVEDIVFDNKYKASDLAVYSHIAETESHSISCYILDNFLQPSWTLNIFNYDKNTNRLVALNGLVLFVGIRKEIHNNQGLNGANAPKYFYFIAPSQWEGITIYNVFDNGADYIVFNPLYRMKEDVTVVIQEAYDEEWNTYDTIEYRGQIVGLNNKIYFFKESNFIKDSVDARTFINDEYPNSHFVDEGYVGDDPVEFDVNEKGYVTRNGVLLQDSSIAQKLVVNFNDRVKIFEYDEEQNTFTIVECAWKYNGGEINGCVSVNGTGEPILTICEYIGDNNLLVPIKHINLTKCTENDDESFYTQAPNIPISNLNLAGRYIKNIPAGVYQFFIRYKIREGFYTNWFPCSKELFAGSRKIVDTLQGSIKHTDLHEDSNNSFVFTIQHLYPQHCSSYEQFQLGFIVSSDGGVFARSWRHFDMTLASSVSIYFDYDKTDIEEVNIDDLLKTSYNIFNVKNVAQYKNRLYIANYTETDFNNPSLQSYANDIKVQFDLYEVNPSSGLYLNNVPLEGSSNVYTSFGGTPINTIYYDENYCINDVTKVSNVILNHTHAIVPTNVDIEAYIDPQIRVRKVSIVDDSYNAYVIFERFQTPTTYGEYGNIIANNLSPKLPNEQPNTIISSIINEIKSKIVGIDDNGNFKININNNVVTIQALSVDYISLSGLHKENTTIVIDGVTHQAIKYYILGHDNALMVNVNLKESILTTNYVYNEYNTFLPFTKYDFYVHFVKQNGIATNGYYICTKEIKRYCRQYKQVPTSSVPNDVRTGVVPSTVIEDLNVIGDLAWYDTYYKDYAFYIDENQEKHWYKLEEITDNKHIIIPNFSNIQCPDGYVSCFISCIKYGNNVAQGYNYENVYDSLQNVTTHKIDCLELNTLLYNVNSNIQIKDSKGNVLSNNGVYYSSATTRPLKYLGGSGHVEFTTNGETSVDTKLWVIIDSTGRPYNKELVKLTPFIKLNTEEPIGYTELVNLNSPGYFCEVITLLRDYCCPPNGYYVSGSDVYTRNINNDTLNLELEENAIEYHSSVESYIFSNYNLNYVSLTSDLTPTIRRYAIQDENTDQETSEKQVITLVNSLLASFSLELKSFYRDYTRKLYKDYNTNNLIKFDNTIRVSSVDVDEIYRYIYRFEATDYYNVPTHRGIITNLVSIANTLYVHCEHSLFKFTDNKTINAQEEEVTLQENDIFNSGISEVFDAQFGYGGLKDRKQSLVTFNAYVFYDAVSKIIYAFGGEQQIGNISESIQKIINIVNPTDVSFVGDELDDRFFVNLRNEQGNVCLSFNFKSKSFISIHDIDFKFGFHTRKHTYFVHDNLYNDEIIGWSIYKITDKLTINNTDYFVAYQNCYTPSLLSIEDTAKPDKFNSASACIDVITNVEYEKVKALNFINWICSEVLTYGNNLNYVAEEELNRLYPGDKIRIYSDSTSTNLIDLTDDDGNAKLANEQRNIDVNGYPTAIKESWQYARYNCGAFSINYFRDIIKNGNIYSNPNKDLFKYKDAINASGSSLVDLNEYASRQNLTQENALIYGKYFVVRFIFNNRNFKIENVTFKLNDYGKTK